MGWGDAAREGVVRLLSPAHTTYLSPAWAGAHITQATFTRCWQMLHRPTPQSRAVGFHSQLVAQRSALLPSLPVTREKAKSCFQMWNSHLQKTWLCTEHNCAVSVLLGSASEHPFLQS